jgi:hypothetical protein
VSERVSVPELERRAKVDDHRGRPGKIVRNYVVGLWQRAPQQDARPHATSVGGDEARDVAEIGKIDWHSSILGRCQDRSAGALHEVMNGATPALLVTSLMESQILLHLGVLDAALRKRRARDSGVADRRLVEVDVPLGGTPGREPEELLGPHHEIHAREHVRPFGQRRMTGV